jgi:hypothetical protein
MLLFIVPRESSIDLYADHFDQPTMAVKLNCLAADLFRPPPGESLLEASDHSTEPIDI